MKKAKWEAYDKAVDVSWAISFTVLRDKFGFGRIRLRRYWDELNKLADEIAEERISITDLMEVIREEAGIVLDGATGRRLR